MKYVPSKKLIHFICFPAKTEDRIGYAPEFSVALSETINGLFNSIALGMQDDNDLAFVIGSKKMLDERVFNAISYRMPLIGYIRRKRHSRALFLDFVRAAKDGLDGPRWNVDIDGERLLLLAKPKPHEEPSPPYERAKIVRFGRHGAADQNRERATVANLCKPEPEEQKTSTTEMRLQSFEKYVPR